MAKLNKTVLAALTAIAATGRVSQEVGIPLIGQGLILVNDKDIDANGNAAAILTDAAKAAMPKDKAATTVTAPVNAPAVALMTGIPLPESKRGFGRTAKASIWPFDTMEIGNTFFVGNSAAKDGDAFKAMGSNVSNANNKHRTKTGANRTVTRKKKGGNGETETVTLPVYKQDRKFVIRAVKSGTKLGDWTAPEDGAIIGRVAVTE